MTSNPGYRLEHCRKQCVKSCQDWSELYDQLEQVLKDLNISIHMAKRFNNVHYHHIPSIALAGCPNGCSQPQIRDIGISGYVTPKLMDKFCSGCQVCINSCLEKALTWKNEKVVLDPNLCLKCGTCIRACTTGRIEPDESGWVLHLGGRLGRHPQLARIAGIERNNIDVIHRILSILEDYLENALPTERLNQFLDRQV